MSRSIDQISFAELTPGVRDNTRSCPTCSGVGVLTATDLFCGAGGSSLGLEKVRCPDCGRSLIEIKYALNHWDLAIQAHNANFPKADHAINGAGEVSPTLFGFTDLGWFSPECFPAGTLVVTRQAGTVTYVPIEQLNVGMTVLTHEGRWRPIVRTQRKIGSTIRVADAAGRSIRVTGNHRFWCKTGDLNAQPDWLPIENALAQPTWWARPHIEGPFGAGIDAETGADPADYDWTLIVSITRDQFDVPVYNIEVDEDHSYVAEGIVVANCTNYSSAKGAKDNSEQAIRSRATFLDIVRFVGHWKYSSVMVENVVEARLWCDEKGHEAQCRCGATFNKWYLQMLNLGYDGEIVYFNSQFAFPTPQSRDRMYVVFWRRGVPRPNLDFTPPSWCTHCETVVPGLQTWKKASKGSVRTLDGLFRWGRYGTQYTYNCPTCANPVAPAVTGAKAIIDWSLPAQKIGERKRPLALNTMNRIRKGLEYITSHRPMTVQVGGNLYERDGYARVWAVDGPLKTLTATNELALVTPAGSLEANARDAGRPMHALTGSDRLAVTFRAGGQSVAPADLGEPMTTITAHDRQRAVPVQAGGTTGQGRNPRDVAEPVGTLTGENHRAVVVPNMANNTGRSPQEPIPAVTGGNRHMLVQVTHAGDRRVRNLDEPAPTVAGHGELGIVSMRNHGLTTNGGEPVSTLTAGGYHHGALMYNGTPGFVRDLGDTAGTVKCRDSHSLLVPYYSTGVAKPTGLPADTITGKDREALVITDDDVDACQFRMLTWRELLRAQVMHELPDGSPYLLTARQRKANGKIGELSNENRVRMIGNAVSAPVATMLGYAVVDVLAGDSLQLAA
jgi:DNA (cytosine-5)-methyltransferase 1